MGDCSADRESCLIKIPTVRADLCNAGFVVNEEKSVWEPTQTKKFQVSARELASFTGQIISTGPVVGNIGRIMSRHCVLSTVCRDNWDSISRLDDYCEEELYFGRKIWSISTLDIAL